MTVKDLKKKAPKGEFLAYINKEEAAALKRAGGSGKLVNGIPSFRPEDYGQEARADKAKAAGKQTAASNPYAGAGQGSGPGGTGKYKNNNPNQYTSDAQNENQKNIQTQNRINAFNRNLNEVNKFNVFDFGKGYVRNRAKGMYGFAGKIPGQTKRSIAYAKRFQEFLDEKGINYGDLFTANEPGTFESYEALQKYRPEQSKNINAIGGLEPTINFADYLSEYEGAPGLKYSGDLGRLGDKYVKTYKIDPVSGKKVPATYGYGPVREGDGGQQFIPIDYNTGAATSEDENEEETIDYRMSDGNQDVIYEDYGTSGYRTTAADGGIMGTRARRAMGGIMNRVDKRQGYFLGKLVKKVGRAAKKVLSSDLGKAAIAGAAFYYGGGGSGMFKSGASGGGGFMGGLKAMGGNFFSKANPLLFNADKTLSLSKLAGISTVLPFLAGGAKPNEIDFSDRGGKMLDSKGNEAEGPQIRAEIDEAYASGDSDRIKAIQDYYAFLPPTKKYMPYQEFGDEGYRTTVATGGRIGFNSGGSSIKLLDGTVVQIPSGAFGKEGLKDIIYSSSKGDLTKDEIVPLLVPAGASYSMGGRIGKAEGGLLDMGGMEKDYRAEGGFVPIGEYEKKDDVPARLSVNEFVFTADAVRGAGQGDIDKGAEIMENMMENLENGGTVSEESQGNKGAQNMFKTSERLGAVI